MSNFKLKILAMLFMTIDHIGYFLTTESPYYMILRSIGRLSFPIFLFLILEGYTHTHNKTKYIKGLYIFAFISIIPFYLCFGRIFNVFFTLGTVVLMLYVFEKFSNCAYNYILFLIFAYISFPFDWGLPAIITVFFLRDKLYKTNILAILLPIFLTISTFIYYSISSTIGVSTVILTLTILGSMPILLLYNGELGFKLTGYKKYFMYIYYPLHLVIIKILL